MASDIGAGRENASPEQHRSRMKPDVLLQLLIPIHGLAVTLRRIDHPAARDAFRLRGKGTDPRERRDRDEA